MVGLFLLVFCFLLRKLHTDLHGDIALDLSMKHDWIDREKQ